MEIERIKEKFTIELIWNDFIYRKFNTKKAIERYMEDFKKISIDPIPEKVSIEEIEKSVEKRLSLRGKIFKISPKCNLQ